MTKTITVQELCQQARATDLVQALSNRISSLWFEAARQKEYADLGGDDYDPVKARQEEISCLIGKLKKAHAELGELRVHRHEWGGDDYCIVCGADGRA